MMPLRPHRCWSGTQKAQVSRQHRRRMGRRHRSAQRRPQPQCLDCRAAGALDALDPPALVALRRRRRHAQRHLHQLRRRWRPASCGGPRARVHASTSWQVARGGWPAAAVRAQPLQRHLPAGAPDALALEHHHEHHGPCGTWALQAHLAAGALLPRTKSCASSRGSTSLRLKDHTHYFATASIAQW